MMFESLPVWLNAVIAFGIFSILVVGLVLSSGGDDGAGTAWSGWG